MDLRQLFADVQQAGKELLSLDGQRINELLLAVAEEAWTKREYILQENRKDLMRMDANHPKYDRLKLTEERLQNIINDIRKVAMLPSPLGKILNSTTLPNGLRIRRIRVPFGVIGVIYEARPNVSFDVCSLCLKSGNACILKGGSDADCSNQAIVRVIQDVLSRFRVNRHTVTLLPANRQATYELLHANGYVDLLIPRGSSSLIQFVRQEASIPVIETGAGICHTYFDRYGDWKKGRAIVHNAKTRRVSVCNALDCLLVDYSRLEDLPGICEPLADSHVTIYADAPSYAVLQGHYPAQLLQKATAACYGTEFLDYKMAVKTTTTLEEAVMHIQKYGSKHSECIVTENEARAQRFCREVDAACVYVNAPTSFTDGAQFGLGAEIGISTQKLHARGPMALEEITTYKWIIEGEGQIRK